MNYKTRILLLSFTMSAAALASVSNAQFTYTATLGGLPFSGAMMENFDESGGPSILTLSGNAGLTMGNWNGQAAAPYFSGSTAAYFGESPATGGDASQYVAVQSGGTATLTFPTPESYLGLLWGSVDTGNTLTFYDNATNEIGTVTGANILALMGDSSGDVGLNGTVYVNITSTTDFSKVVASYSGQSIEIDDVAYGVTVVPEPASYVFLGFGLSVFVFVFRARRSRSVRTA